MTNLDSILKSRDFANKGLSSQSYGFSSSHVWMWELDHKESWALKKWCFWTMVLEKTLEESLGLQGDQTSQSQKKSNLNIHWKDWCCNWRQPDRKSQLITKTDAGENSEGRRRTGRQRMRWLHVITDSMDEFKQAPGDGEGQGSLGSCSLWGHRESDRTEWMNNKWTN